MQPWVLDRIRAAKAEGATHLDLSRAGLTEIPKELIELTNLTSLNLDCNEIGDEEARALSMLTNLTSLSLDSNSLGAEGARAISTLTNLTSLNLGHNWIGPEGARTLSTLSNLTSLSLEHSGIGDQGVRPLSTLRNLTSLNLEHSGISSEGTSALSTLTNLTSLNLCNNFIEGTGALGLSTLTNLTTLNLELNSIGAEGAPALSTLLKLTSVNLHNNGIGDDGVRSLSTLTNLTSLDLRWNCIGDTGARSLSTLTNLTSLNLSRNCLGPSGAHALSTLCNLSSLNLDGNGIGTEGLCALSTLTKLTSLSLSGARINGEVHSLSTLSNLTELNLAYNSIVTVENLRPLLDQLDKLRLDGCEINDLPREVWEGAGDVLAALRAHYRDRELGKDRDAELKVCILGNGRVGKTQMCRRLRGEPFDEAVPTTHGIQLGHLDLVIDGLPFRLNLWDFGGQEIYHGSHSLFLQGQAIFAILWNPAFEKGGYPDGGTTIRHRPLSYWLDFVRGLAGMDTPVLLVQSQCDQPNLRQNPEVAFSDFRLPRLLSFSAKTDLGLTVLRGELEDAIRDIIGRKPTVMIGSGRIEIRNQLRRMLEADQELKPLERKHRTLSMKEFESLCDTNGKISSPSELLRYLDRCGVVIHRPGVFSDQIILDQTWALEAIYTLFDRQGAFRVLNRYGRFTRSDLTVLAWQKFSVAEQELFLSLMQSCGICFPLRKVSINGREAEWEYAAPELLPEWSGIQELLVDRMQGERDSAEIEIRYRFLHEGILRGLLSKLGTKAGNAAVYWKYGCWFHEVQTASQILVRSELDPASGRGSVSLRALGERPRELLEIVLKEALSMPIGQPPEIQRSWETSASSRKESTPEGEITERSTGRESRGLESLKVSEHPDLPSTGKPAIYISYAWGDDTTNAGRERQATVDGLCAMLAKSGYEVVKDDRELRHGDWISAFMKAIGRGDHVLVILSEKYLRSPYCMTELFHIYSRSLGDKEDFLNRVIPVVVENSLQLSDWSVVVELAKHWESEYVKMEPNLKYLGEAHIQQYHLIKQWHTVIATILGFINDTLHPQGFDAITKDDYAAVREMLPPI